MALLVSPGGAASPGTASAAKLRAPVGLYRVEGDGWVDSFYMIGGAKGGFSYGPCNQLIVQCPWCSEVFIPLELRNH